MTKEYSRGALSVNAEISVNGVRGRGWPFVASWAWGTLVGTSVVVSAILLASEPSHVLTLLVPATFFTLLFSGVLTLIGMALVGLPVTWLLRESGAEHIELYAVIGATAGFMCFALPMALRTLTTPESYVFPFVGALTGFASALRWGLWRRDLERARRRAIEGHPPEKPTNPIHDLLF